MKESKNPQECLIEILVEKGLTLSVAESLTGGLISSKICQVPGASQVFLEGIISYSNQSKIQRLGVDKDLIEEKGPVSAQVAEAMAGGVRQELGTDLGLSSTGLAGPDEFDDYKNPRGLFYIGISYQGQDFSQKFKLEGSRQEIREGAAQAALALAVKVLDKDRFHHCDFVIK